MGQRLLLRLLLLWLVVVHAVGATAQEGGTVSGVILDATTSLPLAGATVLLEPAGPGRPEAGTRAATSDSAGRYALRGVPPGTFTLRVHRIGYRTSTVEVELRPGVDPRLSLGLAVAPVALPLIGVTSAAAERDDSYARTVDAERQGDQRVAAERQRQRRYASSDVRVITHADVAEAVLGETDLFRAMHRLPGVGVSDDYAAEFWTRGASWDQTRVHFDGVPLFNPVHALGAFSGVNADAVGAAALHPGVQPVSLSGGGAGVLELRSRRGGGDRRVNGVGELSLVSGRLALDGESPGGKHAWMVAGRRTYLDWLTRAIEAAGDGSDDVYIPYRFYDLAGRYDYGGRTGTRLEVSGLLQRDVVTSDVPDVLVLGSAAWGSGAAQATLHTPIRGLEVRSTAAVSAFRSRIRDNSASLGYVPPDDEFNVTEAAPSINRIHHLSLRGEVSPRAVGGAIPAWSAGYEGVLQGVRYRGPPPGPSSRPMREDPPLQRDQRLGYAAVWAERRWRPSPALSAEAGVRAEGGPPVRNAGVLRLAPRAAVRYRASAALSVSAGVGRAFQYAQAVAPAGISEPPGHHTEYLWALAGDEVPVLRADVATLGAERWLGDGWLAAATAYARRATGTAVQDPEPGSALRRPLFVTGENRAHGLELSARRLTGRVTGSAAYTYGVSLIRARGYTFASPADQRHSLDLSALLRAGRGWQLGAAYSATTGGAFTRRIVGAIDCVAPGDCRWEVEPRTGAPGARRGPGYSSLDLQAERGWGVGAVRVSGYAQVRNALRRRNPGRYIRTRVCQFSCGSGELFDEFEGGLPILPVVGVRVAF